MELNAKKKKIRVERLLNKIARLEDELDRLVSIAGSRMIQGMNEDAIRDQADKIQEEIELCYGALH